MLKMSFKHIAIDWNHHEGSTSNTPLNKNIDDWSVMFNGNGITSGPMAIWLNTLCVDYSIDVRLFIQSFIIPSSIDDGT